MSSRTPSMQELLAAHYQYATADMYTSIPGVVIGVRNSGGDMYVDVQPTINMRTEDNEIVSERPPIINVPLHMPLTKLGGLSYPIAAGNPVWLMFSMRGLEIWKRSNGSPTTPADMRKFDIRDCCAIPGIYPFSEAPNLPGKHSLAHSPEDVVLVHNIGSGAEVEIRLKPNGDVFVNSPTKVTVNCTDAEINASSTTTINCPTNTVNGNTTVNGDFTVNSGAFTVSSGTIAMSASDSASMSASFDMTGSLILNGVVMESHVHPENDSGGPTGGPING